MSDAVKSIIEHVKDGTVRIRNPQWNSGAYLKLVIIEKSGKRCPAIWCELFDRAGAEPSGMPIPRKMTTIEAQRLYGTMFEVFKGPFDRADIMPADETSRAPA